MDYFSNVSNGIPPCTYLRRQIQDSRGRKPSYVCTSTDGQYIAILYFPRSSNSIIKSLRHIDRSISKVMKAKLYSEFSMESSTCDRDAPLYTDAKSYLKFLSETDKLDIHDEIEGLDMAEGYYSSISSNYQPHYTNGRKEFLDLRRGEKINYNSDYGAYIVIYDTFFMNPIREIILDDFFKSGENNSKYMYHTFFIKYALGDSFLLCYINDTLWIIENNYLSHTYCLKLTLAPIKLKDVLQIDTIDLVSVLKNDIDHDYVNDELTSKFIESNKFALKKCKHTCNKYELIIHYENQFPIRAVFCHFDPSQKSDGSIHLRSIGTFYPKIESAIANTRCSASAMITDCKYVYYDENNIVMPSDRTWVDSFTGFEYIENLICMDDGRPIVSIPRKKQDDTIYTREFFCNILIATILSCKTRMMFVLSDLNRKTFGTVSIPFTNNPMTIKYSHNASYVCCFSLNTLALIKLKSSINEEIKYEMEVIYMVNPSHNEVVWDFVDVAFGGDIQTNWLYVSMHRGVNNSILCLYDVSKLEQERITWAEECTKADIELNLNANLFPMCIQMASVPCTNVLLLMPMHQRYISVLAPEYVENWDNTATRIFMRFPLFSSNKEMLQVNFVWDDVKTDPITKETTIPTLTQPTFSYYRGCTSLDSHINHLCSLNIELNNKYNQHSNTPEVYSIWPFIESLLELDDSNIYDIKSPPLRRVRYYGLDSESQNQSDEPLHGKGKSEISNSIQEMPKSLIDEIYSLYKRGLIHDDSWSSSLLFCSGNYMAVLNQMLEAMVTERDLFRFDSFEDYAQRLSRLRELWLTRMEDRGIALRKKCPNSSPFKSLSHPTTFNMLKEYECLVSEGVIDKRMMKVDSDIKISKIARKSRGEIANRELRLANGRSLSRDLLSIIPENKLPLSVLNNVSLEARVDSLDALRRSTAEVALGIYYLKRELDDKNVKLPRNLKKLLSFLTRASVAHHAYVNNPHHN